MSPLFLVLVGSFLLISFNHQSVDAVHHRVSSPDSYRDNAVNYQMKRASEEKDREEAYLEFLRKVEQEAEKEGKQRIDQYVYVKNPLQFDLK